RARPRHRPREGQRQRRRHRPRPPARRDRRDAARHRPRRAGAPRPAPRRGHPVHRRRYGRRHRDREAVMIRYDRDADGVVTLTMDDPDQSANTMNLAYVAAMSAALDRLEAERDEVTGVIVTSAKTTFFAGGDVPLMSTATAGDAPALRDLLGVIKRDLRRLETYGRPVVAAVNGAALGGGLEIAL